MRQFIIYFLTAVLVAFCQDSVIPEPVLPDVPDIEGAPVISMALSDGEYVIHPEFPAMELPFTLANSNSETKFIISESDGVEASVKMDKDKTSGLLTVKAASNLDNDSFLVLQAANGSEISEKRINFNKAFIRISQVGKGMAYDSFRGELTCDIKALRDVRVDLESNIELELEYQPETWLDVNLENDGRLPFLRLCVGANLSDSQQRISLFVIKDREYGKLALQIKVRQDHDADRFTLERNALIALYNALDGPNWLPQGDIAGSSVTNWCSDKGIEWWYGVEVYADPRYPDATESELKLRGHVKNVAIGYFGPKGELPEEIGDLIYCKEFNICWYSQNGYCENRYVSGKVPQRIGEMVSLERLNFNGQRLEEDLESSSLKDVVYSCPNLRYIDIYANNFTGGCPQWLGDIKHFTDVQGEGGYFYISNNRLEGKVPDKVKNHWRWSCPYLGTDHPEWKTWGECEMIQQEGYGLWE